MHKQKKVQDKKEQTTRRKFLKKALYTAPTLIVLEQIVKPTSANAGFGRPPSDPCM